MSLVFLPFRWLLRVIRSAATSPFLTGPLLLAVTYYPDAVRRVVLDLASRVPGLHAPPSNLNFSTATTALCVLFALGVASKLNGVLNTMAANSWRLRAVKGWDWPKEIAVVTGGSSGIGRLVAEKLAALGVRVAVLDVQKMPEAMESNPRIHFFDCDVTSYESVAQAADAIRQDIGHPSILINNAGIISGVVPILKIPESGLRQIMGVNTLSHWFTAQHFIPHMVEMNKGHVVTVASIASFVTLPTVAHYSASKASAHTFHEALTVELKYYHKAPNILTTVVHPNFARTPLIEKFVPLLERSGLSLLSTNDVAEPIVAQIKSCRGGQLILPDSLSLISGIRGWPTWLQMILLDGLGKGTAKLARYVKKQKQANK
ncbi:NAD(P)-binding protein [Nemania abortiva]|nr:NAD(P)-binding protein [Nemania abortiva]